MLTILQCFFFFKYEKKNSFRIMLDLQKCSNLPMVYSYVFHLLIQHFIILYTDVLSLISIVIEIPLYYYFSIL